MRQALIDMLRTTDCNPGAKSHILKVSIYYVYRFYILLHMRKVIFRSWLSHWLGAFQSQCENGSENRPVF